MAEYCKLYPSKPGESGSVKKMGSLAFQLLQTMCTRPSFVPKLNVPAALAAGSSKKTGT